MADYPAIPEPTNDPASLRDSVLALKQAFEILSGQKGKAAVAAVTTAALSTAIAGTVGSLNNKSGPLSLSVVVQKFTSGGTYTPTPGMVYCLIEAVGSGGGGGSAAGTVGNIFAGGGGGAGSYSRLVVSVATIGGPQAVTVGNAGVGGVSGSNNGTAGSDVSVGALCVAKGGAGGTFGSVAQGPTAGAGGVAGTGDLTAAGSPGIGGVYNTGNVVYLNHGSGGSSFFGGGALAPAPVSGSATAGTNAGNYGGGGSGAVAANVAANAKGGDGSKGVVFITEFVIA